MRALRFDSTLHLAQNESPPIPEPDEALIQLRLAGICHTDLELTRGYMGFSGILGHEFVGELVEDAGPYRRGQRVVGEINIACGKCALCLAGISTQCINGRRTLGLFNYPGAFADQLRLPIVNLHAVPDDIPDEAAVFTEPLAAAFQVPALAPVHPGERVALIGAGKLGLLIAQVLKLTGCDLVVLARQPRSIALLQKWQIPVIDSRTQSLPPRSFTYVVEATGSEEGFALALDLLLPRGTLVLKSTYADLPRANLTRVVVDEIKVVGSRCGPFPAALRALHLGLVDVQSMIECTYSLENAPAAFEYAAGRGILKVLLKP